MIEKNLVCKKTELLKYYCFDLIVSLSLLNKKQLD